MQFNSQSSGNTVTESYRACEMAASCNNVRKHQGGAVVFFLWKGKVNYESKGKRTGAKETHV